MSKLLTYGIMQQKRKANLLLDTYTGSLAGLSLRKIKGNYSGYCIEVRRSSDDTTQNIGFTSGGVLDESALTTFVGANDGFVKTWYDQSGNGNNATQTTNANQPKIVSSGTVIKENSLTIIDFGTNSDNWYLTLPSGLLYNEALISYFHVAKLIDNSGNNCAIFGPSTGYGSGIELIQLNLANHPTVLRINNTVYTLGHEDATRLWTNNSVCQTTVFANATSVSAYKNSGSVTLISSTGISALNHNGVYAVGKYSSMSIYGKIGEMIIFETDQSSNRSGIETNINDFYSIY
jgi:hypothetical protein